MTGDPQALAVLEGKARAGDVGAQFEFAVSLDRAGRRGEASSWLEKAGEGGHPSALTLMAIADLQGLERPRDVERAVQRLRRAASSGGTEAQRVLAVLTAVGTFGDADWTGAIEFLMAAAKDDDPQALRQLGLLIEMASPGSVLAEDLLLRAGLKGDGLAAFAVLRRQASGRVLAAEEYCAQWRVGIARFNHPLAQLAAAATPAAPGQIDPKLPEGAVDWGTVRALLAVPPGVAVRDGAQVSAQPFIRRFESLLSAEECEYVLGMSARHLRPAEIVDQSSGQPKESRVRTNSVSVLWPVHQDLVVHALNLRLSAAAGLAPENGEMINVLMYRPGEEYRPHYDFFPIEAARSDPSGQRVRTLLVYLNEDYAGGETHFSTAGHKIKGRVGDGLLFHNCDANGAPDKSSLHAGLPVVSGQKWLLSKWYREKRFVT